MTVTMQRRRIENDDDEDSCIAIDKDRTGRHENSAQTDAIQMPLSRMQGAWCMQGGILFSTGPNLSVHLDSIHPDMAATRAKVANQSWKVARTRVEGYALLIR